MYFFLPDEKLVLVASGDGSEGICQVVGISSNILRKCKSIASFPRRVHTASGDIVSGVPIVCGGWVSGTDILSRDCYSHDRKTNKWNFVAKMKSARESVVHISGRLWAVGGYVSDHGSTRRLTAKTEFIHLDGTVEQGPDLPFALTSTCMVTLHDGRIMLLGGRVNGDVNKKVVIFDPNSNTFSDGPTLLRNRFGHACTLFYSPMHSNRPVILITGGFGSGPGDPLGWSSELLDYTQHNATWVQGNFLYNSFTIWFS